MKYPNKIRKCPIRRNCWDYGDCSNCDIGTEIFKLHKKIDRLKNKLKQADQLIANYAAAERGNGEWKWTLIGESYTCSNCHITQTVTVYMGKPMFNFCPYCGANMRKGVRK